MLVSNIFFKKVFLWVTLRLYTEFQSSTMSGFGQINFPGWVGGRVGGWVGVGLVEIKANSAKLSLVLFELGLSLAMCNILAKSNLYLLPKGSNGICHSLQQLFLL